MRNHRLLASSGITLALLLITTSTSFVLNGYQKVYAASNVPTPIPPSDLAAKIRELINTKIKELFPPSSSINPSTEIILSNFPHQTGESLTNAGLDCSEARPPLGVVCNGTSNIIIPGIGEGRVHVRVTTFETHFRDVEVVVEIDGVPGQTEVKSIVINGENFEAEFNGEIDIPGIGEGEATIVLSL